PRSAAIPASASRVTRAIAVSRMSWLVVPRCTQAAASGPSAARRRATTAPTGLPSCTAATASSAASIRSCPAARSISTTAASGARPSSCCARTSATSAATSAAAIASSETAPSAPTETGLSSPVSKRAAEPGSVGKEDGLLLPLQVDVVPQPAVRRASRDQRSALLRREGGEERVSRERRLVVRQVDARVQLVGQAAREDDERDEGRGVAD